MAGATITLTNPGTLGTTASVARLMPGQGAIVATGAIRDVGASRVMTISSTYDHRVIQGAESGAFLGRIDALLQGADGFYESLGLEPTADAGTAASRRRVGAPRRRAAMTCARSPRRWRWCGRIGPSAIWRPGSIRSAASRSAIRRSTPSRWA